MKKKEERRNKSVIQYLKKYIYIIEKHIRFTFLCDIRRKQKQEEEKVFISIFSVLFQIIKEIVARD